MVRILGSFILLHTFKNTYNGAEFAITCSGAHASAKGKTGLSSREDPEGPDGTRRRLGCGGGIVFKGFASNRTFVPCGNNKARR